MSVIDKLNDRLLINTATHGNRLSRLSVGMATPTHTTHTHAHSLGVCVCMKQLWLWRNGKRKVLRQYIQDKRRNRSNYIYI